MNADGQAPGAPDAGACYDWGGLAEGARASFSIGGVVLCCSFTGFGALVQSLDFSVITGMATSAAIWALPGQVVFLESWHRDAGLALVALAVTLTAVRLLPMAVLVLSKVRLPGAPRWPEFLLAHFIAVTIWVMVERRVDAVDRPRRLPWALGLGMTLVCAVMVFTVVGYYLAGLLPIPLAAALIFFTPAFFLLALFGGARKRFDILAIWLGAFIGPATLWLAPGFELLVAGLLGGTLAYAARFGPWRLDQ